jgi:zinc protease
VLERIGTESTRAEDFKKRLFRISTTLEATAELDRFVVRLQGPQAHMHEALDLLAELMRSAKIEYKPMRQVRRETWAFRRYERKDPPNVGRALRDHVLYGDNSQFQREHGPAGTFFLPRRKLRKAWGKVQGYAVEVGYVGNVAPQDVAAAVSERLPLRAAAKPAVAPVVYARRVPAETTVYFVPRRDAVQTQLWFAVEGLDVQASDRPAADAFSEYFGGSMAGLVFQEVREFRALAYSAQARYWRDEHPAQRGHLLGYVGCQADKTFDALDVMTRLITDMPERKGRLELVRSALLRSQETESPSFRELQDAIDEWQQLGYTGDPRRELLPAYGDLEFADIVDFYRRHVAGRPLAIMVVGDPRKVKPARLRNYGKLVRLREGKLYSN